MMFTFQTPVPEKINLKREGSRTISNAAQDIIVKFDNCITMALVYLLLIMVLRSATSTPEENAYCCPTGQAMIRSKGPLYCWNHESNETTHISIPCNETTLVFTFSNYRVNSAGQLIVRMPQLQMELDPKSFCIGNATFMKNVNSSRTRPVVAVCRVHSEKVIIDDVFGYCMILSTILLATTAVIYAAIPELRDLQGKSIINFCGSLAFGLALLAVMKLMIYSDMNLCAARGFLAYFFLIASFFWTNAISIQILLSVRRPSTVDYGWKGFLWYAVYAWGTPILLTITMAIINFIPGDHEKPGIGMNHCWFFNSKRQWQYMYSVMSILILINIAIFIYTSVLLWRQAFSSSSHIKAIRYKFFMTIRMFIVMGVPWMFEMIGSKVETHIVWEILDVINSLQGLFIFLVLVIFRRRTIKMMHRHGWLDCCSGPVERILAVGEDEEEVVQHTTGISLDDQKASH